MKFKIGDELVHIKTNRTCLVVPNREEVDFSIQKGLTVAVRFSSYDYEHPEFYHLIRSLDLRKLTKLERALT